MRVIEKSITYDKELNSFAQYITREALENFLVAYETGVLTEHKGKKYSSIRVKDKSNRSSDIITLVILDDKGLHGRYINGKNQIQIYVSEKHAKDLLKELDKGEAYFINSGLFRKYVSVVVHELVHYYQDARGVLDKKGNRPASNRKVATSHDAEIKHDSPSYKNYYKAAVEMDAYFQSTLSSIIDVINIASRKHPDVLTILIRNPDLLWKLVDQTAFSRVLGKKGHRHKIKMWKALIEYVKDIGPKNTIRPSDDDCIDAWQTLEHYFKQVNP